MEAISTAADFTIIVGGVSAAVSKTAAAPIERVKLLIQNQVSLDFLRNVVFDKDGGVLPLLFHLIYIIYPVKPMVYIQSLAQFL